MRAGFPTTTERPKWAETFLSSLANWDFAAKNFA